MSIGYPGARVRGSCEPLDIVLGLECKSFTKVVLLPRQPCFLYFQRYLCYEGCISSFLTTHRTLNQLEKRFIWACSSITVAGSIWIIAAMAFTYLET